MCSSPHWQVGSSWFREKLSPANRNKGYRGEQISWKIVSRELNARSYRDFAKISRSWAPHLQNSRNQWAKKWGPTCDRDISNSAIYTTAIYQAYTVLGYPKWLQTTTIFFLITLEKLFFKNAFEFLLFYYFKLLLKQAHIRQCLCISRVDALAPKRYEAITWLITQT